MKKYLRKKLVANVAYLLGVYDKSNVRYPVSQLLKENKAYDKELVCRIARGVGMDVRLHKGEWIEHKENINQIIQSL